MINEKQVSYDSEVKLLKIFNGVLRMHVYPKTTECTNAENIYRCKRLDVIACCIWDRTGPAPHDHQ